MIFNPGGLTRGLVNHTGGFVGGEQLSRSQNAKKFWKKNLKFLPIKFQKSPNKFGVG